MPGLKRVVHVCPIGGCGKETLKYHWSEEKSLDDSNRPERDERAIDWNLCNDHAWMLAGIASAIFERRKRDRQERVARFGKLLRGES